MSDKDRQRTVRIHIDRNQYESPDPTTGEALYELAGLNSTQDLFRDNPGHDEDDLIQNDSTVVDLKNGDHFYTQREITIYVNATPKTTSKTRLGFNDVVALAYDPVPTGPNIMFVIEYSNGPRKNPKGSLLENEKVWIKNGMTFDVTTTDRS